MNTNFSRNTCGENTWVNRHGRGDSNLSSELSDYDFGPQSELERFLIELATCCNKQ